MPEHTPPLIEKMLIVSNSHLDGRREDYGQLKPTQNDLSWLHGDGILNATENAYGWFLHVPIGGDMPNWYLEFQQAGVPQTILNIMRYAEELGCCWIKFDQDGPLYQDRFPTFDW